MDELTTLHIGRKSMNALKQLKIQQFKKLKTIKIETDSFKEVSFAEIAECNQLETIDIGMDSFNKSYCEWEGEKRDGTLVIRDCSSLCSIRLGQYAFGDYSTGFVLKSINNRFTIILLIFLL